MGTVTDSDSVFKDSITIKSAFGKFDVKPDDVQSAKIGLVSPTFAFETDGENVVTLKNGKKYRGNIVEEDNKQFLVTSSSKAEVKEGELLGVEKVVHPPATWQPPAEQWYSITLRDGSKIRTTAYKKDENYTLTFRYGTITAKTGDILVVRKDSKPEDVSKSGESKDSDESK